MSAEFTAPTCASYENVCDTLLAEVSKAAERSVSLNDLITDVGIDSVTAIQLMFSIEEQCGLVVRPEYLAERITFAQLARLIVDGSEASPRGHEITEAAEADRCAAGAAPIDFSLMYFSTDTLSNQASYEILLRSARFADAHGFKALWIPERHFHAFGGTYPNPSVAAAALASITERVRLRAGSVVLPLHDPIRVVEEWSFVDNLSNGRVDLALATGWNPNDFVLAPGQFEDRRKTTLSRATQLQRLWGGEAFEARNGRGELSQLTTYPRPVQPSITTWLTCTGSDEGFRDAGRLGYNVLTGLLFQRPEALGRKIALYRSERERAGFDPSTGTVSLMVHTFLGATAEAVHEKVSGPFKRYLASSIDLWKREWADLASLTGASHDKALDVAYERYARGNALFGTPESCRPFVQVLHDIGVDEIACLIDFGVAPQDVMTSLEHLQRLTALCAAQPSSADNAVGRVNAVPSNLAAGAAG